MTGADMHLKTDVIIAGGGPAGASSALTLLRHTRLRVVLVEGSRYETRRIGETVSPSLQPLLHYLGVWDAFRREGHRLAHGTAAAWGSELLEWHSFLVGAQGVGWHLDRGRFDAMLARAVVEAGGIVLMGSRVIDLQRDDSAWRVLARHADGRRFEVSADFLIDGTGSRAAVASRLGARARADDRFVAAAVFARRGVASGTARYTVIESVPDGWWYAAPVPSGGIVATFLTIPSVVREKRLLEPDSWYAGLSATRHVRRLLGSSRMQFPVRIYPVHSSILEPICGAGWLASGDAAASFDPLSSMGVGHALTSGAHAARAADAYLRGFGGALEEYAAGVSANFSRYLAARHGFYRAERRWPDRPFWAARRKYSDSRQLGPRIPGAT